MVCPICRVRCDFYHPRLTILIKTIKGFLRFNDANIRKKMIINKITDYYNKKGGNNYKQLITSIAHYLGLPTETNALLLSIINYYEELYKKPITFKVIRTNNIINRCCICLNNKETFIRLGCNHNEFCEECINGVIKINKLCPICRSPITNFTLFCSINHKINHMINYKISNDVYVTN